MSGIHAHATEADHHQQPREESGHQERVYDKNGEDVQYPHDTHHEVKTHGEEIHQAEEGHYEGVHGAGGNTHYQDKGMEYEGTHESAMHEDHEIPSGMPLVYLFYWGILILIMVIILIYFVYRFKKKQTRPIIPLAVFFVLFAIAIYVLEIMAPTFTGRFDPVSLRVVNGFHEGTNLGFLRFLYKFLLGIFMTFFAFFNLDRKRYNSMKDTED
ncbi:MAG: hypothetical protein ACMUIM_02465 [bacterium]